MSCLTVVRLAPAAKACVFAGALALCVAAGAVMPGQAQAAGMLSVKVGTATVAKSGKVTLPVKFSNNPGIAGFGIKVNYDAKRYKLVSIKPKAKGLSAGQFSTSTSSGTALWFSASNMKTNGTALTLNFKAKAGAPKGKSKVTITSYAGGFCNAKANTVKVKYTPGYLVKK